MRLVGALAWLPLLLAAYPAAGRAQIVCTGPESGPTAHCPDCIYDTYGEPDPSTAPRFACAQFFDTRPLGGNPNSDQYADPFVVEGGNRHLESAMIRLRLVGMPMFPGDVVVRVWDDDDVLGNDDPENPASFMDNRPGNVLARAVIPQEAVLCVGTVIHQGTRCDVTGSFDETPILEDGVAYWVGAAMTDAATSVSWVQTTGETQQEPVCAGPNCSEEWVFANSNAEVPTWNAATNVDPVGLVRLVPEPSVALLRAGLLATLLVLRAVQRRGLADSSANGRGSHR